MKQIARMSSESYLDTVLDLIYHKEMPELEDPVGFWLGDFYK